MYHQDKNHAELIVVLMTTRIAPQKQDGRAPDWNANTNQHAIGEMKTKLDLNWLEVAQIATDKMMTMF